MRRLGTGALMLAAVILAHVIAEGGPPAPITVDYPADQSIFPPEITPPTFLWRDPERAATTWRIAVAFTDGSPTIHVTSPGERMQIGEIDERCISPTNELPKLTPQQAEAHTWKADPATWTAIKNHSQAGAATVTISGFRDNSSDQPVSRGQVTIQTSKDPVGAPIFYRDVPL